MRDVLRNVRQYLAAAILRILPMPSMAVDTPSVSDESVEAILAQLETFLRRADGRTDQPQKSKPYQHIFSQHPQRKGH